VPGGMALHAVSDGDEISAQPNRVAHALLGKSYFCVGKGVSVLRCLIFRQPHIVANGLYRSEIGDDGIEIARQQGLVKACGHHRCERHAGKPRVGRGAGLL